MTSENGGKESMREREDAREIRERGRAVTRQTEKREMGSSRERE